MKTTVEVEGVDEVIARLTRLRASMPLAAAIAQRGVATAMFALSQAEVPKRTGALASSGHLGALVPEGNGTYSTTISYGPIRYARIVHYNNHLDHRDGKSYFLIDPFNDLAQAAAIAAAEAVSLETST